MSALRRDEHQRSIPFKQKQNETYRSRRLSADCIDPINLIRDIARGIRNPQPVNVIRRVNGRHDRPRTLSDENRVRLSMESLGRSEIPDGRDPRPGRIRDEVVISENDFGGHEGGDDRSDLLNGDFGRYVDPSCVQGLLDRAEEIRRDVVQA